MLVMVPITNFMQQLPSWEANSHSSTQEIPSLLWNPKVHYNVHRSLPLVHSETVEFGTNPLSSRYILLIPFYLFLGHPSGLFLWGFLTKVLYAFLSLYMPCSSIILDLITAIIYGIEYKLWNSSLCSLLHLPIISSLLGPNILVSILF